MCIGCEMAALLPKECSIEDASTWFSTAIFNLLAHAPDEHIITFMHSFHEKLAIALAHRGEILAAAAPSIKH